MAAIAPVLVNEDVLEVVGLGRWINLDAAGDLVWEGLINGSRNYTAVRWGQGSELC